MGLGFGALLKFTLSRSFSIHKRLQPRTHKRNSHPRTRALERIEYYPDYEGRVRSFFPCILRQHELNSGLKKQVIKFLTFKQIKI